MKTMKLFGAILMIVMASFIHSCKKSMDETPSTASTLVDDTQSQSVAATDEETVQAHTDLVFRDADDAFAGLAFINNKASCIHHICGGTVQITDTLSLRKFTVVYDGVTRCRGHVRSGSVTVAVSDKWSNKGTVMSITFNNLKVTNAHTGKFTTINGSKTIVNVNGGAVAALTAGSSVIIRTRGAFIITFDNGSTRSWGIASSKIFTLYGSAGDYQVTTTGDTLVDGRSNVLLWGINRFGNSFHVVIKDPIVANSVCEISDPVSGVIVHTGLSRELTVTLGVDQSGNPVTFTGNNCPYGYKLAWINAKGEAKVVVMEYEDEEER